jgi:hypothetical protein
LEEVVDDFDRDEGLSAPRRHIDDVVACQTLFDGLLLVCAQRQHILNLRAPRTLQVL